jgi:hypothetical protein
VAHGDKVFIIFNNADKSVLSVHMSVSAAQDVYNEYCKHDWDVTIINQDVNVYPDPENAAGPKKRYVDPDTARKLAKKAATK